MVSYLRKQCGNCYENTVRKTKKRYTKEVILTLIVNQNWATSGPVSKTEEGVVSLFDLTNHRA